MSIKDIYNILNFYYTVYRKTVYYGHLIYMVNFQDYIKSVRAQGHYAFTAAKACSDLSISPNALNCGMYKLRKKGDIVSPAKSLHVIVPPEYQHLGCLPAEELVPILMKHWGLDYYVCLLSAALYHGASHQKPQVFQVMTNKQIRPLECGKVKIEFIYKKSLKNAAIQKIAVKSGYLVIATPELTAMDLLLYPHHGGGLNHIATVLSELIDVINPEKLQTIIEESHEKAWVQRLGYLLDHIDPLETDKRDNITDMLSAYLGKQVLNFAPLASELPIKNQPKNSRWMMIENTTIESDL
jgi:predicted transcriptional regulator of viral defense system